MTDQTVRTGGQLIVDCLAAQGVEHVFCVPGESYLAVLDALHDASIAVTVCRQEGGATMMAEATARLTGRPGLIARRRHHPCDTTICRTASTASYGGSISFARLSRIRR